MTDKFNALLNSTAQSPLQPFAQRLQQAIENLPMEAAARIVAPTRPAPTPSWAETELARLQAMDPYFEKAATNREALDILISHTRGGATNKNAEDFFYGILKVSADPFSLYAYAKEHETAHIENTASVVLRRVLVEMNKGQTNLPLSIFATSVMRLSLESPRMSELSAAAQKQYRLDMDKAFKIAMKIDRNHPIVVAEAAMRAFSEDDQTLHTHHQRLDVGLTKHPYHPYLVGAKLELLVADGDLTTAYNLAQEWVAHSPEDQRAATALKNIQEEQQSERDNIRIAAGKAKAAGNFAEATKNYEKYLDLQPDDTQARLDYAKSLRHVGKWQEAIEQTGQLISADFKRARYHDKLNEYIVYEHVHNLLAQRDLTGAQDLLESAMRRKSEAKNPRYRFLQARLTWSKAMNDAEIYIDHEIGCETALSQFNGLIKESYDPKYEFIRNHSISEAAICHLHLCSLYRRKNLNDAARRHLARGQSIIQHYPNLLSDKKYAFSLAELYFDAYKLNGATDYPYSMWQVRKEQDNILRPIILAELNSGHMTFRKSDYRRHSLFCRTSLRVHYQHDEVALRLMAAVPYGAELREAAENAVANHAAPRRPSRYHQPSNPRHDKI